MRLRERGGKKEEENKVVHHLSRKLLSSTRSTADDINAIRRPTLPFVFERRKRKSCYHHHRQKPSEDNRQRERSPTEQWGGRRRSKNSEKLFFCLCCAGSPTMDEKMMKEKWHWKIFVCFLNVRLDSKDVGIADVVVVAAAAVLLFGQHRRFQQHSLLQIDNVRPAGIGQRIPLVPRVTWWQERNGNMMQSSSRE